MAQYSKGFIVSRNPFNQYLPDDIKPNDYETTGPTNCWIWKHTLHMGKYPRHSDNYNQYFHIHRFICEHKFGKILKHQRVEWTCGDTRCINPNHIRLVDKAWVVPMRSKLGVDDIAQIKIDKRKLKVIAAEYEVSVSLIKKIRSGDRHLLVDAAPEPVVGVFVDNLKVGGMK